LTIEAIYGKGREKQVVVLDHVTFSKGDELFGLKQPCLFQIRSRKEEKKEGFYSRVVYEIESLEDGKIYSVEEPGYLYDAGEWVFDARAERDNQRTKQTKKINELKDKISMLSDILVRQGNRVIFVSDEEEKKLLKKIGIMS